VDNGGGIAAEDLDLAFTRHATSKIRSLDDLEAIDTLGFRGEGLAAIAAVARTQIVSRRANSAIGARVVAFGETIGVPEPTAAPIGTRVRAEALFEAVPARREYLRSNTVEFGRISAWLSAFALAYPHVAFTLRHDGRDVWVMPSSTDARERLAMTFGREAARDMLVLDASAVTTLHGDVRGFVSAPGSDRPDRRMQLLFVNGRLLRSTLVAGAWSAGYSTFTMVGRHPYGAIFLQLPADSVDANVHPTKSDVRLRYGAQVSDAVRRAIAATLQANAAQRFRERTAGWSGTAISLAPETPAQERALFEEAPAPEAPRLRAIEQLHRTYVLASDGDGLLLVDQHAAHERIAYERIVAHARAGVSGEPLLVPVIVELDAAQSRELDRRLEALREAGLEIEPFGERTYRIVATPAGYRARAFDVRAMLADLGGDGRRDVRERVWATLACHSVTVAGERLELPEMAALVDGLQRCANPMHCPHGRPTMVRLDSGDIARLFKRV